MLYFFLDDSGTDDRSPVITMAGYVARAHHWELFFDKRAKSCTRATASLSCTPPTTMAPRASSLAGAARGRCSSCANYSTRPQELRSRRKRLRSEGRLQGRRRAGRAAKQNISAYGMCS